MTSSGSELARETARVPARNLRAGTVRAGILLVAGVILLIWTWGKLGDARVDWPKELHVAWRVSEGAVPYRDVEYLYGPLPLWINALWFKAFGTSIRTLVLCNAAILALITLLLDRILRRFVGPWSALAAGVVFLTLFAFSNSVGFSNYNYLTPYAHGMTHGIALLLLGVWALLRWMETARLRWVVLTGAAAGLSIFTKPEIAVAAAATLVAGVLLMLWVRRVDCRTGVRAALICFGSATLVVAMILGFMFMQIEPKAALRGTFASYIFSFDEQIRSTKFYRDGLGIEHPRRNLAKMVVWCSHYGRLLLPAALVGLLVGRWASLRGKRTHPLPIMLATMAGVTVFFVVWRLRFGVRWEDAFRGLGAIVVAIDLVLVVMLVRAVRRGRDAIPLAAALLFGILAIALLPKMTLNVRIYQYGFVLAMPAMMIALAALLDWLPRLLRRAGGDGSILVGAGLGLLAAVMLVHLHASSIVMARKHVRLWDGPDTIWAAGEEGQMLREALNDLPKRIAPGQTLAVLPEASIFNYLLRVRNSTPFDQLTPIGARVFGGQRVTRAFIDFPPDWIVLMHQDTAVFGPRYLGRDFLADLGEWIRENYVEVARFGDEPLRDMRFGIAILRRADAEKTSSGWRGR